MSPAYVCERHAERNRESSRDSSGNPRESANETRSCGHRGSRSCFEIGKDRYDARIMEIFVVVRRLKGVEENRTPQKRLAKSGSSKIGRKWTQKEFGSTEHQRKVRGAQASNGQVVHGTFGFLDRSIGNGSNDATSKVRDHRGRRGFDRARDIQRRDLRCGYLLLRYCLVEEAAELEAVADVSLVSRNNMRSRRPSYIQGIYSQDVSSSQRNATKSDDSVRPVAFVMKSS